MSNQILKLHAFKLYNTACFVQDFRREIAYEVRGNEMEEPQYEGTGPCWTCAHLKENVRDLAYHLNDHQWREVTNDARDPACADDLCASPGCGPRWPESGCPDWKPVCAKDTDSTVIFEPPHVEECRDCWGTGARPPGFPCIRCFASGYLDAYACDEIRW